MWMDDGVHGSCFLCWARPGQYPNAFCVTLSFFLFFLLTGFTTPLIAIEQNINAFCIKVFRGDLITSFRVVCALPVLICSPLLQSKPHVRPLTIDIHAFALSSCRCSLCVIRHALYPRADVLSIIDLEWLRLGCAVLLLLDSHNSDTGIVNRQLAILHQALLERLETMTDQLLATAVGEGLQVLLQVCARHLAAGANGESDHLLGHAAGLELEQVRAMVVDAGDQKTDTVGSLAVVLRVDLRLGSNHVDEGPHGHVAAVREAVAEALLLHEVGEDARVRGETGDGDADMFVDGKELLLVRGEFFGVTLNRERRIWSAWLDRRVGDMCFVSIGW